MSYLGFLHLAWSLVKPELLAGMWSPVEGIPSWIFEWTLRNVSRQWAIILLGVPRTSLASGKAAGAIGEGGGHGMCPRDHHLGKGAV